MTTYAKKCAARATSATVCSTGKSSSPNSRTPTASPRLVTGANGSRLRTVWSAHGARGGGEPHQARLAPLDVQLGGEPIAEVHDVAPDDDRRRVSFRIEYHDYVAAVQIPE